MTIRTPSPSANRQSLSDLNRIKERLAITQEQISSGSAISRLGDDPTGAALIVDFRASVARNNAYVDQADTAGNFLSSSETAVSAMETSLVRLMELATNGLDTNLTANGRASSVSEVSGLRDSMMALANTQVQGKYIFAGTNTTTEPFSYTGGTPPVAYSGNSGVVRLDVSLSASVATNVAGDALCFGSGGAGSTTDMFQVTTDLMNAMSSNDIAQIQTAFNNLKAIHEGVNTVITDLGGRQAGLDSLKSNLESYNLSLQAIQGTYEDLDYAAAITQFTRDQTAQQAALSVMARVNDQNLFDFLG
ncbi:flagellar hook-associated protein FlgL [Holophaga foetida]|uniref:flagellar hook-associated protein FlgL n=1 Tax=Holophaga foetida TaxID=35839 RepID=UPI0002474D09|nr:flagellar hook-associated protein FlgL [Holophaga foetida]